MPKKNLGYILPAELEPEGDRCVIVFIPDTQEDLRALLGSLEGLSQWVNWERTGDNSGSVHAQRWKRANLKTLNTLEITDCELIEDLVEDGDMSVNVTNNVSCGGCGGQCGQCPVITPDPEVMPTPVQEEIPNLPEQTDPGGEDFPDGFTDRETYLLHKCRAARELARDIIQTIGNFGSLSGILAAIGAYALGLLITAPASAFVASLLAPLIAIGASVPLAIAIVGSALLMLIVTGAGLLVYFNTLQSQLAVRIDEITCALYQASSGAEAREALIEIIDAEVLNLVFDDAGDKELFTRALQSILSAIMSPTIFKVLFVAGEALTEWLSERDDGFDCTQCAQPLEGYLIQNAASIANPSNVNTGTHVINGHEIEISGNTNGGTSYDILHGNATNWYALIVDVIEETGDWRQDAWGQSSGTGQIYTVGERRVLFPVGTPQVDIDNITAWCTSNGYVCATPGGTSPPGWTSTGPRVRTLNYGAIGSVTLQYKFILPLPA